MSTATPCPPGRAALILASARAAFRVTIPIFIGFGFCGFSYGLYMRSLGFEPLFPILMALTIFAGSLEFIMASMLTGPFAPLTAFVIGLIVNARHLFYGISMLEKYSAMGRIKPYLIFGLTDETFSINSTVEPPADVDRKQFY
ncbi:MAG: AzlC family ABC transporter permease, partial [Mailhella sp.]|nr:AzlC family ABC transporter permease [Mailhella sp.]